MVRKRFIPNDDDPWLPNIPLTDLPKGKTIEFRHPRNPLWTENKAKLIERYLYYFVLITKHGTYIDGFAGPQEPDKPEMWAAKLVLENEPRWMKHFYLYDIESSKFNELQQLRDDQPTIDSKGKNLGRDIQVFQGNFNELICDLLKARPIRQKEATFCLLDQRTFECKWSTVKTLAEYKDQGFNKIELFYFLPNSWQDRALAGLTANPHLAFEWWGGSDSKTLLEMGSDARRDMMCERFKSELGYTYATPWAIYEKAKGRGAIMYYMIHATDHNEAPKLMERAYHFAVKPKETVQQISLLFPDFEASENPAEVKHRHMQIPRT